MICATESVPRSLPLSRIRATGQPLARGRALPPDAPPPRHAARAVPPRHAARGSGRAHLDDPAASLVLAYLHPQEASHERAGTQPHASGPRGGARRDPQVGDARWLQRLAAARHQHDALLLPRHLQAIHGPHVFAQLTRDRLDVGARLSRYMCKCKCVSA